MRILYPKDYLINIPSHISRENHVARILQKYTILGVSHMHPVYILKSPSNIASKLFKKIRRKTLDQNLEHEIKKHSTKYLNVYYIKNTTLQILLSSKELPWILEEKTHSPMTTHKQKICRKPIKIWTLLIIPLINMHNHLKKTYFFTLNPTCTQDSLCRIFLYPKREI